MPKGIVTHEYLPCEIGGHEWVFTKYIGESIEVYVCKHCGWGLLCDTYHTFSFDDLPKKEGLSDKD